MMRRSFGPILVGLGMFLLVAGLLVKFYAVPKLAVAPIDQQSVTNLEATGATIFDTGQLKNITTDLSVSVRTVGDVDASEKAPDGTAVWVSSTSTRSSDGQVRSRSVKRVAFDQSTGAAVNCCGNFIETQEGDREQVERKGQTFKFPFFAEKKTYEAWDDTLQSAVPARYTGTTKVKGMTVYTFEADVPATQVGTREVPASVLGEQGSGNVEANSMYQAHTTYYIEPTTGAPVNQVVDQKQWLTHDGNELVTTEAEIAYTDDEVQQSVDDLKGQASMLSAANSWIPLVLILLGLLGLVLGGLLSLRSRRA